MFSHVVLGFLRDGRARHGYELLIEYKARFGEALNAGNLYRELSRLAEKGMVQMGVNPPGVDTRRIPYQITERGRHAFDQWLAAPSSQDGDFPMWLVFIDGLPSDARERILDRRQERLWMQGKLLAREREDALERRAHARDPVSYDPLPALLDRRIKLVTAELEFLKHFRTEYEQPVTAIEPASDPAKGTEHERPTRRERKPR
jgi:DNA-binding PadR family transcriptional regulator